MEKRLSVMKISYNRFVVWEEQDPKVFDLDALVKALWSVYKNHSKFEQTLYEILTMEEECNTYIVDTSRQS
jgi:hypothetical protein